MHPFPARLIAATIAINLVVVGLTWIGLIEIRAKDEARATATAQNLSDLLLHDISNQIDRIDKVLLVVADEYEREAKLGRVDGAILDALMRRQRERYPELLALRITDNQGEAILGVDSKPKPGQSPNDREYFLTLRDNPGAGLVISKPLKSRMLGQWGVVLARSIVDGRGGFAGIVYGFIGLDAMRDSFGKIDVGPNGSVALRGSDLGIIVRSSRVQTAIEAGDKGISNEYRQALAANPNGGVYVTTADSSIDKVSRLHSYRRHPEYGFLVNVGLDRNQYLVEWRRERMVATGIVAIVMLSSGIGVWFLIAAWRRREHAISDSLASQAELQAIYDTSSVAIFFVDMNGVITHANRRMAEMFNCDMKQLIGSEYVAHIHPDEREVGRRKMLALMASEIPSVNLERHYWRDDGSQFWGHLTGQRMRNRQGNTVGLVGVLVDVTERRLAEEALRLSQERFAKAFNASPIAASIARAADGCFLEVNQNYERDLGWTAEDLLGRTSVEVGIWPSVERRNEWADVLRREGRVVGWETQWRNKGGELRDVSLSAETVEIAGETCILAFVIDITEKRRTEKLLHDHRAQLEREVAERTHELAAAKTAAEAANRAKSAFLANMSHEIRTPLNAITGMAHLIRRDGVDPSQSERLEKIDNASRHLLKIINNILDVSKIEADKIEIEAEPLAPAGIVGNVLSMLGEAARAKGLELRSEVNLPSRRLIGDATRLQQVLLNFGTNAVKFTDRGHVILRAGMIEETDECVLIRFEVEDSGVGIEPAALERIFEAFEQADGSTTRRFGGTGLGLAIARKLARLMGGDAGVVSSPGQGSTFWFTARLIKGANEAQLPAAGVPDGDAETALLRGYAGKRVLLVEDDVINREVASELLTDVAIEVDVAGDGEVAVQKVEGQDYDLILMDVQMPRLNGIDATRRIRMLAKGLDIPIIALTANAFAEDRAQCLDAGMDDFLAKPIDPDLLFGLLLKWLARGRRTT